MAYVFGCKNAGSACSWTAKGASEEEVMAKVAEHAEHKHGVTVPTSTIASYLKSTLRQS